MKFPFCQGLRFDGRHHFSLCGPPLPKELSRLHQAMPSGLTCPTLSGRVALTMKTLSISGFNFCLYKGQDRPGKEPNVGLFLFSFKF